MEKKKWFVSRKYGWGWTPVTWQGYLVVLAFLGALILNAFSLTDGTVTFWSLTRFYAEDILLVVLLGYICYKTGEWPRWRWREKDKK